MTIEIQVLLQRSEQGGKYTRYELVRHLDDGIHFNTVAASTVGSLLKQLNVVEFIVVVVKDNVEFLIIAAEEFGIHLSSSRAGRCNTITDVWQWQQFISDGDARGMCKMACSRAAVSSTKIRCACRLIFWDSSGHHHPRNSWKFKSRSRSQNPRALSTRPPCRLACTASACCLRSR
jgi:hypothetical protein